MKFTSEQLDKWKRDINAIAVIGTRIRLTKNGKEAEGLCPFHDEKTPSFKIYFKNGWWQAHCHGQCGETWNVFQVVQKMDRLSFEAAVDKVLKIAQWEEGKELVESTFAPVGEEKKKDTWDLKILDGPQAELEESAPAQEWLAKRGITMDTARVLGLGFCPNLKSISPNHPWVNDGWVMFPTVLKGRVVSVKFRSLMGKKTPEGKSGILRAPNTGTFLYNLESVSGMDDCVLVEGEPDVAVLTQAGYMAVGLPSAEYTPSGTERDALIAANRVFLAGDSDGPGQAAMRKLWNELRERVYLMEWPAGCKDANEALLKECGGDTVKFQELIEKMKAKALERPIPDYYDVIESVRNTDDTSPMDNPRRLHFSNKDLDAMAVTLPGNVVSVYATYTGSGKTTWCLDGFELEEAMNHGSVVLNYSAELSPQEFSMLVASNLLGKDRLKLQREDFELAARMLEKKQAKFYVGYNPDLNRIGLVLDSLEWAVRRLGARIVVLDHLHFLCRGEKDEIKAQGDAMQRIKNIAVKYQVIFVVVGQSRKEQPNRKSRPSEISDAKGSESFTSDASTVYHIHRNVRRDINWDTPDTWPRDILENVTDIRLPKCRTKGPGKAVCRLFFRGEIGKFFPHVQV